MSGLDNLSMLYGELIEHAIVIKPESEGTGHDEEIYYDVIDAWWDISLVFKSERLFPDQTRRHLTYKETIVHCNLILMLIKKFYPGTGEHGEN